LKRLQQQAARQLRAAKEKQKKENAAAKSDVASADATKKKSKKTKVSNSVRRYDVIQRMKKEYYKNSRRKDAAAIELSTYFLDVNNTLLIQDEQIALWKKKKKCKKKDGTVCKRRGSGRVVQHGILGRLKKRLTASPQTHVINKWVPTTKLCTHCGKIHKNIQLGDREFTCPHCKRSFGGRDMHAAQTEVWLYYFMPNYIGLDGSEFKRGDFDNSLAEIFSAEGPYPQMDFETLSDDISEERYQDPDKELIEG
jgi:hypothetical protein